MSEARIRIEGVSRSFGDLLAVDNVSFEVPAGRIVGLLGPNGAGKTTTLRMLATLLQPDSGQIFVDGIDLKARPLEVRARMGYQTGDTGLYGRLTSPEFLRYFGRLHGLRGEALEQAIERVMAGFAIHEFAKTRCQELSTGQRQRVSIARALLHDPSIVVLDEPTAGLDIVSSSFVLETLQAARGEGRAVLFSTHILSEVELICDDIVVMHRGRVIAHGTLDELKAETEQDSLAHAFLHLVRLHDGEPEKAVFETKDNTPSADPHAPNSASSDAPLDSLEEES